MRLMAILLVFSFSLAASGPSASKVILGVLEDTQYSPDQPDYRSVRAIFRKQGNDWQPFPTDCPEPACLKTIAAQYPGEMIWTIAFDGKSQGTVTSRPKEFERYSSIGQQQIISEGPVPTTGKKSTDFGGFLDANVFRPLVAVSQPYFKDPDSWKPERSVNDLIARSRRQFRKKFPKLCKGDENESTLKPFPYRDEDIKPGKIYSSSKGWSLVELRTDAIDCGDTEAGFNMDNQWFVIDPQKSIRFLGAGMWLVDAGDYDNDGKSEVLFAIDQYNRGGYKLFYDDFRKQAAFQFSYH